MAAIKLLTDEGRARTQELHEHYAGIARARGHSEGCALIITDRNWPTIMGRPTCSCGVAR